MKRNREKQILLAACGAALMMAAATCGMAFLVTQAQKLTARPSTTIFIDLQPGEETTIYYTDPSNPEHNLTAHLQKLPE